MGLKPNPLVDLSSFSALTLLVGSFDLTRNTRPRYDL